jgi:methyl-accepting chemotaxis protein
MIVLVGFVVQIAIFDVKPAYIRFFSFTPPIHTHQTIRLTPGDITIAKGSTLTINITNPIPTAEYSIYTRIDELWRVEEMANSIIFNNIDHSFFYFIENQWSSSDTFFVNVIDDPNVLNLSVKYFFPEYINKRTEYIENSDGFIIVPEFTEIEMTIQTTDTIREANLVLADRSFIPMASQGRDIWQATFTPTENTNYHFAMIDELGNQNQIVSRSISLILDQPPTIAFIFPARDTLMTKNHLFDVRLTAGDDYGLQNLKIYYQVNQNAIKDTLIFRQATSNFVIVSHTLDFTSEAMFPGDEITYWAEVFDNSPRNQRAVTEKFKLRFPSIEDIFNELERQENERNDILNQIQRDMSEMQREFDMKRRELIRRDDMNWDDKQMLEKFIQDQQTLNDMVQSVAENYQDMIDNMQQNEAISEQMLEKMQRIQEIMEQIASDDIRKAMEQLQQSMERMNPQELRTAMENMQFNLQDFAEKLEQTLKLLQDIKNEQNLEKSLQLAQEMHDLQQNLNQKTADANDVSALSDEQQAIADKLAALQEQLQKTMDEMQNTTHPNTMQAMEELMQQLEDSELGESLSDATDAMQQNNKPEAMKQQQQSLQKMSQMVKKMEQMKSDMAGSGMQEVAEAIQNAISRLLMISREHTEKVRRMGNDPVPFMPAFINDFEAIQLTINQLYQTTQVLLVLGQKFFNDLNRTINAYRFFFNEIQNSRFTNHKNMTSDISAGINLVIYDLMQAMNNMDDGDGAGEGGGGSGMQSLQQSLEQMSAQQMMMNSITQSLFEQMSQQGNRMSNQMREQLQEIAAEEQRLADNLKRMLQTNPEAQRHANALNEMSNELEDVARRIRQNRIDQSLLDQQNRIMSRLLEVQRSINQRDNSNQRRGDTAIEQIWELPTDLDLNFQNAAERQALEDEIQRLPLEYRRIILEYLRKMNE